MRKQLGAFVMPTLFAVSVGVAVLMSSALAQEGPFGDASLRGTYSYVQLVGSADGGVPTGTNTGLIFYDGEGTYRFANMISSGPGEPDEEGNPTRDIAATIQDPATYFHFSDAYEVNPEGSIILRREFSDDLDGLVTRVAMIDGVLTIVEHVLMGTEVPNGVSGGLHSFHVTRLVDEDIVPPAPEPEE